MIRMYKYRAFAPKAGRDAFFNAVSLKREMWAELCAMQSEMAPAFAAARKAKDKDAQSSLRKERTARIADIRRGFAARGLAWGDYNAVVLQFDGAVRASARRLFCPCVGGMPTPCHQSIILSAPTK